MSTHKRGDSWSYIGTAGIKDPQGALIDLTAWTIASQAKNPATGELVATFTCAWISAVDQTYTHQLLDTTGLPLSIIELDVQFTSPSGFVISTPTTTVTIVKDVTAP